MSTLNSILNIARSAISTQQTAVRVTSQNIANAQTDGYTRQRVTFVESLPDVTPIGRLGTGVQIYEIARVRSDLLDSNYRRDISRAEGYELRHELLGQVESVLGELSETGLAADMDAFWGSWADLANSPTSDTARELIARSGAQVATKLQNYSQRLDDLKHSTRLRLTSSVADVNGLAQQVAEINQEIVVAETGGYTANDLRDQRDRLVDEMAKLGSVRIVDRRNGSIAVILENAMVVDGANSKEITAGGIPLSVTAGGVKLSFSGESSAISEMLNLINTDVPAVQANLDELASGLIAGVNALHTTGFDRTGAPGAAFFEGTTARDISVSAVIEGDPTLIVASDTAGAGGNNSVALALAGLRDDTTTMDGGTKSFAGFYRNTVTEVALQVRDANNAHDVYSTVAAQADIRRQSVSGVSTDEELIRLIQHQQAYTAATRLVTAVDEMMNSVLNMV
ncbi:MAG TPA: flagellar hook-associated protein FlgK [Longimicrobiaceae bacterium]|nr:flagellar hook-associated protein FlgK [Longimicrobiaceae bacterium]